MDTPMPEISMTISEVHKVQFMSNSKLLTYGTNLWVRNVYVEADRTVVLILKHPITKYRWMAGAREYVYYDDTGNQVIIHDLLGGVALVHNVLAVERIHNRVGSVSISPKTHLKHLVGRPLVLLHLKTGNWDIAEVE